VTTELQTDPERDGVAAVGALLDRRVRSFATDADVREVRMPTTLAEAEAMMRVASHWLEAHAPETLRAMLRVTALWPRDCRLCAKFTTQTGGCTSTVQCVDSDQYKATVPRQYWVSGPNVQIDLETTR
jgi:hypothetical protein